MAFVHDEASDVSTFRVYDAKTMSPEPVAQVPLPRRVPYGFHGLWMNSTQLREHWQKHGVQAQAAGGSTGSAEVKATQTVMA